MKLFLVLVNANVYDGKYYDYRAARVPVVAESKEEARKLVDRSRLEVLNFIHRQKTESGRWLIPHREAPSKNVFFRKDGNYTVDHYGGEDPKYWMYSVRRTGPALTNSGRFYMVRSKGREFLEVVS